MAVPMTRHALPAWVDHLWSAALLALPLELRAEDGDAMRATFEAQWARERERGRSAAAALMAREILDLIRVGVVERWTGPYRARSAGPTRRDSSMNTFMRDIAIAWRGLRRRPVYPIVATLTLALGIGGATAMFFDFLGNLFKPFFFRLPDNRCDQSSVNRNRNTDVSMFVQQNRLIRIGCICGRYSLQRHGRCF